MWLVHPNQGKIFLKSELEIEIEFETFFRDYIGISEDKLRAHFKLKHKTNNIKPFLLKRICRICANDTSGSDAELVKHIDAAHPRSNYWVDEDDDEVDDADDANVASEKEEEEEEEEDVLAPELIIRYATKL